MNGIDEAYSVELPLSIIVGCLPTLYPLLDRKKRRNAAENKNEAFVFTYNRKGHKIRQTTSMSTDTSVLSPSDCSLKQEVWVVEDKV